jgi:hypothetical protein
MEGDRNHGGQQWKPWESPEFLIANAFNMDLMRRPEDVVRDLAAYLFRVILYIRQAHYPIPKDIRDDDRLRTALDIAIRTINVIADNSRRQQIVSIDQEQVLSQFDRRRHVGITFTCHTRTNAFAILVSMRGGVPVCDRMSRPLEYEDHRKMATHTYSIPFIYPGSSDDPSGLFFSASQTISVLELLRLDDPHVGNNSAWEPRVVLFTPTPPRNLREAAAQAREAKVAAYNARQDVLRFNLSRTVAQFGQPPRVQIPPTPRTAAACAAEMISVPRSRRELQQPPVNPQGVLQSPPDVPAVRRSTVDAGDVITASFGALPPNAMSTMIQMLQRQNASVTVNSGTSSAFSADDK